MPTHYLKTRMLLTLLLVFPTLCMSKTPYWHNLEREVRYHPVGDEFVNVNGDKRFSRAIYGTNTGFRFETSDFPEFGLYMPNLGGSVYLAVKRGDKAVWVKDLEWVESRFVSGKRTYTLKDKGLLDKGSLKITALALSDADGFLVRIESKNLPKEVQLLWIYGAASDKRFSRNGDIGADPADCFWIAASKCTGNQYDIQANAFTVNYGKDKKLCGLFPKETVLRLADAGKISELENLLQSEKSETPLLIASQPIRKGVSHVVFHNPTTHAEFNQAQLNQDFIKAEAFRVSIADRVKIETPDPYLNTLGGILSGAEDAIWEAPSYLHGAIGWRIPLTGWRGSYLADVLGFHDRARMHFDGYANAQVTNVPVTLPPTQDPKSNLSRSEKTWGTPMYSNGYISRNPNKANDMHHYDMNLVYIDELLWHLNWTGDWKYAREIFPVIKRHLAWEKLVYDPDNDGLYDGYCCIWASDGLQYNGGVATHSTAYNYRANRMAAMIAEKLGEDPSVYQFEAGKILNALNKTLWIQDKGWWAEFKDNMGEKMLHEDAAVWTVYHAIDSEVQDPFQAYEATRYVDTNIPHIPVLAKNLGEISNYVISTSDWQTYNWSINNVALAEVTHTALAFWQAGRGDEAYKMFKGSLLDAMYMGSGPGNITQISFYDAARGETYRDFADPIATTARALVQGLFGIQPDLLNNKLVVRPGFPIGWDHASLQTKNMRFKFTRNRNIDRYEIEPELQVSGNLTLEVDALMDQIRSVIVNGRKVNYTLKPDAISRPKVVIEAGLAAVYDITVVWGGAPIVDIPVTWEVQPGKSYCVSMRLYQKKLYDPEGVLGSMTFTDSTFTGLMKGLPGHRTVFARVRQGNMYYWRPLDFNVTDTAAIIEISDTLKDLKNIRFEKVNLNPYFNDRVRDIWAYGKYVSPRWPYTTLNVPTQGMGEWTHPEDLYKIDDRGLRLKAGSANEIRMPGGVPFATPGDSASKNVVFTTQWDNYPKSVSIPLSGKASKVYLLLAASTYHMQNHVLNGTVTVTYTDGSTDVLKLILPESLLPLDQDIYTDGFAFTLKTPRPYRIRLKTGEITRNPAADLHMKQGNGPLVIDGGLATMSELKLNPAKELKTLELRTIANEVIIGLMSATLIRTPNAQQDSIRRRNAPIDPSTLPANTLPVRTHDPVMIKQGDTYYLFATGMGVEIQSSKDLKTWSRAGRVFPEGKLPAWHKDFIPDQNGHLWAPDIQFRDGKYHLYYSVSAWMNFNSSIGYATNTTLDPKDPGYKWEDRGCVVSYKNGGDGVNVIDPNAFLDEDGKLWLLYGSYQAGLRLVELDRVTGKMKNEDKPKITVLTTTLGEGVFLLKSKGYYYIFASRGRCCAGVNSTYQVVIGRSKDIHGPYLNKKGKSWVDNEYTLFMAGDDAQPGKGHNGFLMENGKTKIVYHAYTRAADGASLLTIQPVYEDEGGWPTLTKTNKPFLSYLSK